jgi:hypothetical protein
MLDLEIDTDLVKDSVSIEVWEQEPASLRVQVLSAESPQLRGLAFATDGTESVSYSPHANQVLVGPAHIVKMPSVIEQLITAWEWWMETADPQQARLIAREREDGYVIYKVEVPLPQGGQAQYWIDAQQWGIRRVAYRDMYLGDGTIQVQQMDCSPSGTPPELPMPDGVPVRQVTVEDNRPLTIQEAQLTVSFPVRTPSHTPEDTDFAMAYQLDKNLALVYAGERPFTLVQGPHIGDVPLERATPAIVRGQQGAIIQDQEHEGLVLIWREEGLQFSIAGSLSQQEALRIAESLDLTFKSVQAEQNAESAPSREQ